MWSKEPTRAQQSGTYLYKAISNRAIAHIETDIKGPVPRSRFGYNSILVIEDRLSKFAEMCPLRDQGTDQVCQELKKWIGRYGVSLKLHSDNGLVLSARSFKTF